MIKILVIGQAPAIKEQKLPYDTTMLYEWLELAGIKKEEASEFFDFDAVYDKFPGKAKNGGHLKPSKIQMEEYWDRSLKEKVDNAKSIIVLGACAKEFLQEKNVKDWKAVFIPHPSRRNYTLFHKNKEEIIGKIKQAIGMAVEGWK